MPRDYERPPSAPIGVSVEGNSQWIDMLRSNVDRLVRDVDGLGGRLERRAEGLSGRITSNREDVVMLVGRDGKNGKITDLLESSIRQGERIGRIEKSVVSRHDYEIFVKEVSDEVKKLTVFKAKTTAILIALAGTAGVSGSVIAKLLGG